MTRPCCTLPTTKPSWVITGRGVKLPKDSRVVCPDCRGRRTNGGAILDKCANPLCEIHVFCEECHGLPGPCTLHACPRCAGKGLVCPVCRGDRWVQFGRWDINRPIVKRGLCDVCCEGNQINPLKEQQAIDEYLRKHGPQITVVKELHHG